jgi:hypothetical protein
LRRVAIGVDEREERRGRRERSGDIEGRAEKGGKKRRGRRDE